MAYAQKRGRFWHAKYLKPDGKIGSRSKDDNGNRFLTKSSAVRYAKDLEAAARSMKFIDPQAGKLTLGAFVEQWLPTLEIDDDGLSMATYRSRLDSQILPRWQDTPLTDVTSLGYRAWKKQLDKAHSANYVRGITGLFRMIMDDAVAEKLIGENPMPPLSRRRRGRYVPTQRTDEYVWAQPTQVLAVAENARALRGLTGYVMILTIAYTGLRMGEIAGLRREYVHLADPRTNPYGSEIQIEHQGHFHRGKDWRLDPPKYGSYRRLVLPPFLAELLRELLASHQHEYVFTSITGKCLRVDDEFYGRFWHPVVDGAGAEPRRKGTRGRPELPAVPGVAGMVPHGLRHSHKVWLDEDGLPAVAVETRMGHKVQGVEGTYSHVSREMERQIQEALQKRWKSSVAARRRPRQVDLAAS